MSLGRALELQGLSFALAAGAADSSSRSRSPSERRGRWREILLVKDAADVDALAFLCCCLALRAAAHLLVVH